MAIRRAGAACIVAAVAMAAGEASAQRSLFGIPLGDEPAPAPAAPAQPKRTRKPTGPVPARVVSVQNASQNTLTALEVSGEGKSAKLAKPLAPKGRTTLTLPAMKGCTVSVAASFDGLGEAQATDFDICRDRLIRFTDG